LTSIHHRFLAQIFRDPSLYPPALLTLATPGYKDLDEQIPDNDGKSKKERRSYFHRFYVLGGNIEQRRCRHEMERKLTDWDGFPKESWFGKRQDASVLWVRNRKGRISPLSEV